MLRTLYVKLVHRPRVIVLDGRHTLGPWHARGPSQPDNTGGRDWCVLDDDGKIIAECFEHVGFSDDRKTYAVRPAEANAHLISTVPEMLEALIAVMDVIPFATNPIDSEIHQRAYAVIRKAKGEL